MKDLSRNVTIHCPVCGNDQFSSLNSDLYDLSATPDDTRIKCSDCQMVFTKAELIEANQAAINDNIEDIKKEAVKEIEKELKKALKKLR